MAVRSAFALGLHRVSETMVIFKSEELTVRRNLWRSLFVLDRFLAASLGRPTAISEDDCSDDALATPERPIAGDTSIASGGLDAAVRSCQVIGQILKKVYSKRKISTKVALEIADSCKTWMSSLHPDLHYSHATTGPISPIQGIAILHINLLYYHSIILLTRPFFLYLFTKIQEERMGGHQSTPRFSSRMERFCEACVTASTHTISLVQVAFEHRYLPQRNPFVLYVDFAWIGGGG
jgi:Fungal specific transcription factor domain